MSMTKLRRNNAFRAVTESNLAALTKAVKNRIDANWREHGSPTGTTILEAACIASEIEIAEWLIEKGSDINASCSQEVTIQDFSGLPSVNGTPFMGPLVAAIHFQQPAALAVLLRHGVNLDAPFLKFNGEIITCRQALVDRPELHAKAEKILVAESTLPAANDDANHRSARRL